MFGSETSHSRKYDRNQVVQRKSIKDIADSYKETGQKVTEKQISESQLERFAIELKEKRRKEHFIKIFVLSLISILVISGFLFLLT